MARDTAFVFRVNAEERRMIEVLARQLQRNQSDAMRRLIRGAYHELEAPQPTGKAGNDAQQV
jgi:hypothetical protein